MKFIINSRIFTLIDNEDLELALRFKWSFNGHYLSKSFKNPPRTIYLHREIMQAKKGQEIDHINNNKLDNRKNNLRFVSTSQNSVNKGLQSNNTSGMKGVCWYKREKRWVARIMKNQKNITLGYFKDINNAKNAYNFALKKHFGEFARLNP